MTAESKYFIVIKDNNELLIPVNADFFKKVNFMFDNLSENNYCLINESINSKKNFTGAYIEIHDSGNNTIICCKELIIRKNFNLIEFRTDTNFTIFNEILKEIPLERKNDLIQSTKIMFKKY